MATKKISELPSAGTLTGAELVPIVQAGVTSKTTVAALSAPDRPVFSAKSASQQALSSNTSIKINFATEIYDSHSYYDTATSTFTPLQAGLYRITGQVTFASVGYTQCDLYKNGTLFKGGLILNSAYSSMLSCLVQFNGTTDYVEFRAYIDRSANTNSNMDVTYFEGEFIRP